MKKIIGKHFALFVLLLVFLGCQNPSDSEIPPGTGNFSIRLEQVNIERTLVPKTEDIAIALYELKIYDNSSNLVFTDDRSDATLSDIINLDVGFYDLLVTAYLDSGKTKPVAYGSLLGFEILGGSTLSESITLLGNNEDGEGIFSWDITYPLVGTTTGTLTITQMVGGSETLIETLPLDTTNRTDTRDLDAGYYRVVFHLHNTDLSGKCAEQSEIVHIYQNMDSTFEHAFTDDQFHNIRVKRVIFGTESTATVNFCNLNNNNIYLVKVNTSSDLTVSAGNTGSVQSPSPALSMLPSVGSPYKPKRKLAPMGRPAGEELFIVRQPSPKPGVGSVRPSQARAGIGTPRDFWVEKDFGTGYINKVVYPANWEEKPATLLATSGHANVWVMDENNEDKPGGSSNKIGTGEAQELADKFNDIYLYETNILGFENGGGTGGDGGVDGDKKIQILLCDIDDGGAWAGYFWSKDFADPDGRPLNDLGHYSNKAEMFYIDVSNYMDDPDYIYSTLVHEFQHLINYSRKVYITDKETETWYDEMLSMMAEDVISPLIGVGPGEDDHPINYCIDWFLEEYHLEGITEWDTIPGNIDVSYDTKYAFGAYLLRNFGGANLLYEILDNEDVNVASITSALQAFSPELDFEKALSRYGEAMIYSDPPNRTDGLLSFNNTVTKTINGQPYTATGFDIWNDFIKIGPTLYATPQPMRPNSIIVHSGWTYKSGSFSVTLQKPFDPNIELFLMVK